VFEIKMEVGFMLKFVLFFCFLGSVASQSYYVAIYNTNTNCSGTPDLIYEVQPYSGCYSNRTGQSSQYQGGVLQLFFASASCNGVAYVITTACSVARGNVSVILIPSLPSGEYLTSTSYGMSDTNCSSTNIPFPGNFLPILAVYYPMNLCFYPTSGVNVTFYFQTVNSSFVELQTGVACVNSYAGLFQFGCANSTNSTGSPNGYHNLIGTLTVIVTTQQQTTAQMTTVAQMTTAGMITGSPATSAGTNLVASFALLLFSFCVLLLNVAFDQVKRIG
jgi:hypothetical protein